MIYECTLSQMVFEEPVIIETGFTVEKVYIEQWFKNNTTCPFTRKVLTNKRELIPNKRLKQAIDVLNDIASIQGKESIEHINYATITDLLIKNSTEQKLTVEEEKILAKLEALAKLFICDFTGAIMNEPVIFLKTGACLEKRMVWQNEPHVIDYKLREVIEDFFTKFPQYNNRKCMPQVEQSRIEQALIKKDKEALADFAQKYKKNTMFKTILKNYKDKHPNANIKDWPLFLEEDKQLLIKAVRAEDQLAIEHMVNDHLLGVDILCLPLFKQKCKEITALELAYIRFEDLGSSWVYNLLAIAKQTTNQQHLDQCANYERWLKEFCRLRSKYKGVKLNEDMLIIPTQAGILAWKKSAFRKSYSSLVKYMNNFYYYNVTKRISKILVPYLHYEEHRELEYGIKFCYQFYSLYKVNDAEVVIMNNQGDIRLWNLAKDTCTDKFFPDKTAVNLLAAAVIDPAFKRIIYGLVDGRIYLWDFEKEIPDENNYIQITNAAITSLEIMDNGKLLTGASDGTVRILSQNDFSQTKYIDVKEVPTCIYQPKHPNLKQFFVAGHRNGDISVWDLNTGQHVKSIVSKHPCDIYDFDVSPDGTLWAIDSTRSILSTFDLSADDNNVYLEENSYTNCNTMHINYVITEQNRLLRLKCISKSPLAQAVREVCDPQHSFNYFMAEQDVKTITTVCREQRAECSIQ